MNSEGVSTIIASLGIGQLLQMIAQYVITRLQSKDLKQHSDQNYGKVEQKVDNVINNATGSNKALTP